MKKIFTAALFHFLIISGFAQPYAIGNIAPTFVDPDRNNRNIPTEVFYPAITAGNNAPVADGVFPMVIVGHGFAMTYAAYEFLWEALVPLGYIVALPKTESSIFPTPSHSNFGLDMAFLVNEIKASGLDEQSPFFGKIAANAALLGHSMGGGASFLGAANNENIAAVIGFAPAETNPSAIAAAAGVSASTLIFAGSNDCVTPPPQHQIPIYENVPEGRKMLVTVNGGGHCFFADYNFFCSFGEGSCTPSPAITRAEQQNITLSILIPFLDFQLKGSFDQWQNFNNQLNSQPVEVENGWTELPQLNQVALNEGWNSLAFANVPVDHTFENLFRELIPNLLYFSDGSGMVFSGANVPVNYIVDSEKPYLVKLSQPVTFSFAGYHQTARTFELSAGWNLMPMLIGDNITVIQLFGKTAENLILKEVPGNNVYWYQKGVYSLSVLQSGRSYMIKTPAGFQVEF